ncbi:thioesterase superfamily protein [Ophiostoma piceae UAMH 11346]|uniref:Thioesterase superfamily protein n=1 Tax=Ophiostoma piceae (strain UAMH 11346) TaxID=1262450 RepID=S3CU57_OPHP1|nr:thioesterase superfamily protein [Ophiostoma piceae UAMH 11346]
MSQPKSSPEAGVHAGPDGQSGLPGNLNVKPDSHGEIDYFLSIPWCRAHLRPAERLPAGSVAPTVHIVQPSFRRRAPPARNPDGSITSSPDTIDNAFATTLNSKDTIGAFTLFYNEPAAPAAAHPDYRPPVVELKGFMRLGSGMNGHIGLAHGGFVATILDEVLGLLIPINRSRSRHNKRLGLELPLPELASPAEVAAAKSGRMDNPYVTGYLNTTYVRPVKTMATILVTARYTRVEGTRKYYFEGGIHDENNQLLAKGECVFITLKGKL